MEQQAFRAVSFKTDHLEHFQNFTINNNICCQSSLLTLEINLIFYFWHIFATIVCLISHFIMIVYASVTINILEHKTVLLDLV